MERKTYRWCAVPQCTNTSITSNKIFFDVPQKAKVRKKWLQLARRKCEGMSMNSPIHFCEDHFDLPNDMQNYRRYRVMGHVDKVQLKPGRSPSRFLCQILSTRSTSYDSVRKRFPLVCRICFGINCDLYLLRENIQLYKGYEDVTGLSLADEQDLPPYVCSNCADQLLNSIRFKNRILQAHLILQDILKTHGYVSIEVIQAFIKAQQDGVTVSEPKENDVLNNDTDVSIENIKRENDDEVMEYDNMPKIYDVKTLEELTADFIREMDDMVTECGHARDDNRTVFSEINKASQESTIDEIKTEFADVNFEYENVCDNNRPEIGDVKIENGDNTIDNITTDNVDVKTEHEDNTMDNIRTDNVDVKTEHEDNIMDNIRADNVDVKTEHEDNTMDNIRTDYDVKTEYEDNIMDNIRADNVVKIEYEDTAITDVNLEYVNKDGDNTLNNANEMYNDFAVNNMAGSFNQFEDNVPHVKDNDVVKQDVFDEELVNDDAGDSEVRQEDVLDGIPSNEDGREREEIKEENLQVRVNDKRLSEYSSEIINDEIVSNLTVARQFDYSSHSINKLLHCDKCDFKSRLKKILVAHFVIHSNNKLFTCSFCNKEYSYKRSLINHLEVHSSERLLTCNICGKEFCQRGAFFRHMKKHGEEPVVCDVCKQSDQNCRCETLTFNINRPFLCHICDKAFTRNFHFKNHMLIHSGEKPHVCEVCKMSFRIKSKLKAHMRRHLRDEPFSNVMDSSHMSVCKGSHEQSDKQYKCGVCQNSFRRKYHNDTHMLIHTGNKPYSCGVCNKTFRRNTHLTRHLQTHGG